MEERDRETQTTGESVGKIIGASFSLLVPIVGAVAAVEKEADAWDRYLVATIALGESVSEAIDVADRLLLERRKRFSVEEMRKRMDQVVGSPMLEDIAKAFSRTT